MARRGEKARDVAVVHDRRGCAWTVEVTSLEEEDERSPWADMTPEERVALVSDCVLDALRAQGKSDR